MHNEIKSLINNFFEKLNINIDSIEITETDEDNVINLKIQSEESWIIIGPHWKNLDAIQSILKIMISKLTWEKSKLHLEINDYVKTKDDRLFDFIKSKIDYVEKSWKDFRLPFYNAYERKKIHSYVADMKESWIFTKSIWEWKERRLYICKQEKKLTIDIDWDDI